MIEFLQAVKRQPALSSIPFLCSRVLASVLSDDLIGAVGNVCRDCGAVDLLDLGNLEPDAAQSALKAAVAKYAARRPATS